MDLKSILLPCLLLIFWISCFIECKSISPYQYQSGESDVEFVSQNPAGIGPGYNPSQGPMNIFKNWMNFVQGFFQEGNWDKGGPDNLAKFIGNQVSKLVEMLTKDETYGRK